MSSLRQALLGIMAALFSSAILLGSILLALSEHSPQIAQLPKTATHTPFPIDTPAPGQPTFTASPIPPTQPPQDITPTSSCPPRPGWQQVIVAYGDNLESLALSYGTTPACAGRRCRQFAARRSCPRIP